MAFVKMGVIGEAASVADVRMVVGRLGVIVKGDGPCDLGRGVGRVGRVREMVDDRHRELQGERDRHRHAQHDDYTPPSLSHPLAQLFTSVLFLAERRTFRHGRHATVTRLTSGLTG